MFGREPKNTVRLGVSGQHNGSLHWFTVALDLMSVAKRPFADINRDRFRSYNYGLCCRIAGACQCLTLFV